jgi:hypothetical protein
MLVAFIFKRSTRTHPDLFKFEHSLSQIFHLTRYVLLLCKGAAIAAALVDQLMADVDSLSMSSIVPGSLRKSLYTIFQHILNGRRFVLQIIHFYPVSFTN